MIAERFENGIRLLYMTNNILEVEVAPELGGKITELKDVKTGFSFLWKDPAGILKKCPPGSDFDPNFYGGIDEVLPNDMSEIIDGISFPDHGELWTSPLTFCADEKGISMTGRLSLTGLEYTKKIELCSGIPAVKLHYTIKNSTNLARKVLWKFHAALEIDAGDEVFCSARKARVADAQWSFRKNTQPFLWPVLDGNRTNEILPEGSGMDFIYLYDFYDGCMGLNRKSKNITFAYCFDKEVFPYAHYFVSYGEFRGHYTAVLEPGTAMTYSVCESAQMGKCLVLEPERVLETTVYIYAGETDEIMKYCSGSLLLHKR